MLLAPQQSQPAPPFSFIILKIPILAFLEYLFQNKKKKHLGIMQPITQGKKKTVVMKVAPKREDEDFFLCP